jgi:two-component system response regulator LytT
MKVLIVEDEIRAARRLTNLVTDCFRKKNIEPYFYESLDSVSSTISFLQQNPELDIVFLDIQLSDGLSFEIFENITLRTPIVFTTAYDEFALKAFHLHSIDYLLKPIESQALGRAVDKFFSFQSVFSSSIEHNQSSNLPTHLQDLLRTLASTFTVKQYKSRFLVSTSSGYLSIEISSIAYFFSEHKISWLITTDGKKYCVDIPLEEIASSLDPNFFFRANRQYIVSHQSIVSISHSFNGKLKAHLKPNAPEEIIIGREKASQIKEWLNK